MLIAKFQILRNQVQMAIKSKSFHGLDHVGRWRATSFLQTKTLLSGDFIICELTEYGIVPVGESFIRQFKVKGVYNLPEEYSRLFPTVPQLAKWRLCAIRLVPPKVKPPPVTEPSGEPQAKVPKKSSDERKPQPEETPIIIPNPDASSSDTPMIPKGLSVDSCVLVEDKVAEQGHRLFGMYQTVRRENIEEWARNNSKGSHNEEYNRLVATEVHDGFPRPNVQPGDVVQMTLNNEGDKVWVQPFKPHKSDKRDRNGCY